MNYSMPMTRKISKRLYYPNVISGNENTILRKKPLTIWRKQKSVGIWWSENELLLQKSLPRRRH